MRNLLIILMFSFLLCACRKKPDPIIYTPDLKHDTSLGLHLQFRNVVNGGAIELKKRFHVTPFGDSFIINNYQYYISNISFIAADGNLYAEPESYHLIDEKANSSRSFFINGIPEGSYTKIRFLIGVDSLRNVSGAQTGALDPVHGMFWDWDSGYIMAKLDFATPQMELNLFHVAGWKAPHSVLRWVTLDLPKPAVVTKNKISNVYVESEVTEWFKTPHEIRFSDLDSVYWTRIADNYANMFKVVKVD